VPCNYSLWSCGIVNQPYAMGGVDRGGGRRSSVEVELMPSEEAEMRPTATGHNSSIQCRDAHPILGTCCIQCAFQNNNGFFINAARAASLSLQPDPSKPGPTCQHSFSRLACPTAQRHLSCLCLYYQLPARQTRVSLRSSLVISEVIRTKSASANKKSGDNCGWP
jgi:hypothetical protein